MLHPPPSQPPPGAARSSHLTPLLLPLRFQQRRTPSGDAPTAPSTTPLPPVPPPAAPRAADNSLRSAIPFLPDPPVRMPWRSTAASSPAAPGTFRTSKRSSAVVTRSARRRVVIQFDTYPHIMDRIIQCAPPASLLALGRTSSGFRARTNLELQRRWLSLAVTCRSGNPEAVDLRVFGNGPPDAMPPFPLRFLSRVRTVDIDGNINPYKLETVNNILSASGARPTSIRIYNPPAEGWCTSNPIPSLITTVFITACASDTELQRGPRRSALCPGTRRVVAHITLPPTKNPWINSGHAYVFHAPAMSSSVRHVCIIFSALHGPKLASWHRRPTNYRRRPRNSSDLVYALALFLAQRPRKVTCTLVNIEALNACLPPHPGVTHHPTTWLAEFLHKDDQLLSLKDYCDFVGKQQYDLDLGQALIV